MRKITALAVATAMLAVASIVTDHMRLDAAVSGPASVTQAAQVEASANTANFDAI
jgi:hypothetical protein